MNCMKCGREVEEDQVFCQECLEQMENEPIRISTPVHIPRQPTKGTTTHHAVLHPEDEIRRLERANERLRVWVILLAMASLLLAMAVYHKEVASVVEELGKNYSVVETKIVSRGIPR